MKRTLNEVGKGNLTTAEFTLLCLLNNDAQLNEGDVIERHISYYMTCLSLSERQVQRHFKSLEGKGYVDIERTATLKIRLKRGDKNDDKNDDKNVTLKRTSKRTSKTNKKKKYTGDTYTGETQKKKKNDFSNEKRIFTPGEDAAFDNPNLRDYQRMVDKAVIDLENVVGTGVYDILNPLWKEAIRHTYDRDEYVEYFNRGIAEAERKYGWGRNYTDDLINRYNSDGLIVEESYGDRIGQYISAGILPLSPSCAAPLSPHNSKFAHWEATG